jgi:hypothetical protein
MPEEARLYETESINTLGKLYEAYVLSLVLERLDTLLPVQEQKENVGKRG